MRAQIKRQADWPRYVSVKTLAAGGVAYYWAPQRRDVDRGFTIRSEALGQEYAAACDRALMLNAHLDAWRAGRGGMAPLEETRSEYGTFAWLVRAYVRSAAYSRVSMRSRSEYERALDRIEKMTRTDGRGTVGGLALKSITPAAVDRIYERLQLGPRGKRIRQANLSIDVAGRAWDVVHRLHRAAVPAENPWRGVLQIRNKTTKPAATRDEAYALAVALRDIGEPHLGAAALIAFEWHQRPEHIRAGDITWTDIRPPDHPTEVFVRHPKTGEKDWLPLDDEDGTPFFPELEAYLAALPRLGIPVVLTAGRRGPARPYSAEYAQRKVREAREHAGLGDHVTIDACRHGGMTELGDSGATEAEGMALSMHKTPQAHRLYVKRTRRQRINALRKRRALVAGNEAATVVGIGRRKRSRNETARND
ncbi:MAG: hypothetical protein KDJ47_08620 [Hyphomicrobiaceae bacterium]|nr:hypothetical protein [Hyphomicrobiaceae bacterium]